MRRFFDTNVLVYLFDSAAPAKQARARDLLDQSTREGSVLFSTQVLQEFFSSVTRKLTVPLPIDRAEDMVREFAKLAVIEIKTGTILQAIGVMRRHRFSFWDSLIVQAAVEGGATVLYSEDLQHGRVIDTLRIENPFEGVAA